MNELRFFRFEKVKKQDKALFDQYYEFCRQNEEKTNDFFSFGYETFGIVLYKFCTWLMSDLNKEQIDKVLFFSRDGYIIQKAFQLIPGNEQFSSEYIYVSRRSLRVPTLWFGEETIYEKVFPTKYISLADLLSSIGLEPSCYQDVVARNDLALDVIIRGKEIETNSRLAALLRDIWADVEKNSKKEYENAVRYIAKSVFAERVAVVDIGWRGTMQKYLQKILNHAQIESKLRGYYITLNSDLVKGYDMHGYLGNVDGDSSGCDRLRGYVGLIETLFLRTEGSTHSYQENSDGEIVPVLDTYEYMDDDEISWEARNVIEIQNGALQFIRDYVNSKESFLTYFTDELAFHNLDLFATMPSIRDVKMFSDFRFYNNDTISYLAKTKHLTTYLFNLKMLKKDFYESRWRIGFMKNMLKIRLPYNVIMNNLMKYVRKQ